MRNDKEVQVADALLRAFRQEVPQRPERLPTFLEITGYPHYEDVCSNILAFYLDPKNPHGLGTLFLDAIACIGKIEDQQGMSANVEVAREIYTKTGKRMDILIESDTHAVLIENKIYHTVANPLEDYAEHINCLGQRHKHKLLLTLQPDKREDGFVNVTHEQLVDKIRELLGAYVSGADTRYLTFMLDFLNTLERLKEGMVMNPEFIEFLKSHSHHGDIESLLGRVREFKIELRGKISQLGQMIDLSSHPKVEQWKYREQDGMWDILVHDIEFAEDFKIVIDTAVDARGWKIEIFIRGADSAKTARLADLLETQEVCCTLDRDSRRFVHWRTCDYAADLKEIADLLGGVVSRLANTGT